MCSLVRHAFVLLVPEGFRASRASLTEMDLLEEMGPFFSFPNHMSAQNVDEVYMQL